MSIKRLKKFWTDHETKIILILGFLLVSAISLEIGFICGQKNSQKPLIIEKPAQAEPTQELNTAPEAPKSSSEGQIPSSTVSIKKTDCAFVGSKNSDKYHLPTCPAAKKIKPENLVCFPSVQAATERNYLPAKDCLK